MCRNLLSQFDKLEAPQKARDGPNLSLFTDVQNMNTSATSALVWSADVQLLNAQFRNQVILLTRESLRTLSLVLRAPDANRKEEMWPLPLVSLPLHKYKGPHGAFAEAP